MVIHTIAYSEFDNDIGPIMMHQYPTKLLNSKQFFSIYKYIIAIPELCENIITTQCGEYGEYYIMSYPIYIYDYNKYDRNSFHFSLSFILTDNNFNENVDIYKEMLIKITNYLVYHENTKSYVSSDTDRKNILNIISKIYDDINNRGMCKLAICDEDIVLRLNNNLNKKCILF